MALEYQKKKKRVSSTRSFVLLCLVILVVKNVFFFHAIIPSESMYGTLKAGDVVIKNVWCRGGKTPRTLLGIPLVPPTIFGYRTYRPWVQIPNWRLRTGRELTRGSVVSFHRVKHAYDVELGQKKGVNTSAIPLDKRSEFVKRLTALPGDDVAIRNGIFYVNDALDPYSQKRQYVLRVWLSEKLPLSFLRKHTQRFGEKPNKKGKKTTFLIGYRGNGEVQYQLVLRYNDLQVYKQLLAERGIREVDVKRGEVPFVVGRKTLAKNMDTVTIPYKGMVIQLDENTHPLHLLTLEHTEDNFVVKEKDDQKLFYLNGNHIQDYCFPQDHVLMVGDNINASYDSLEWGTLPVDHITGEISYVIFNWKNFSSFFKRIT